MQTADISIKLMADIADLQRKMDMAQRSVDSSMAGITKAAGLAKNALGALGVGLSVGALTGFIKHAIDAADEMSKLSQKTGVSVKELGGLQLAYRQSGIDAGALQTSMSKLSVGVLNGNDALKAMGIQTRNTDGSLKSTREVLGSVAEKFAGYSDGIAKTGLAVELFGRSGADMIPLLNGGAEALAEFDSMAEKLGLTIDEKTAQSAEKFNDTIDLLGQGVQGIARRVSADLLPTLTVLAGEFLKTMTEGDRLKRVSDFLSTALRGLYVIGIGVVEVFSTVGKTLGSVAAAIVAAASGDFKIAGIILGELKKEIGSDWNTSLDMMKRAWTTTGDAGVEAMAALGSAAKKNAPEVGEMAKQAKKVGDEFEALRAKITGKDEGLDSDFLKNIISLSDAYKRGAINVDNYRELAERYVKQQKFYTDQVKEADKATEEYFKTEEKQREEKEKAIGSARLMIEQIEFEAGALRMTNVEREVATKLRDLERSGIQKNSAEYEELAKRIREAVVSKSSIQEGIDGWKTIWDSVDRTAHDTFVSIFDSGKSAFDRLKDTLKNGLIDMLYQMTIKKWIINIAATGTMAGASSVANAANSGLSLVNTASGIANLFSAGSAMAGGSLASVASGSAYGTAMLSEQSLMLAAQEASGMTASFLSSASGISSALASIPGWGWAALAAAAVAAYIFSGDGPETDTKLTFGSSANSVSSSMSTGRNQSGGNFVGGAGVNTAFGSFGVQDQFWIDAIAAVNKPKLDAFLQGVKASDDTLAKYLTEAERMRVTAALNNTKTVLSTGAEGSDPSTQYGLAFSERIKLILEGVDVGLSSFVKNFAGTADQLAVEAAAVLEIRSNLDQFSAMLGRTITLDDLAAMQKSGEALSSTISRIVTAFNTLEAAQANYNQSIAAANAALKNAAAQYQEFVNSVASASAKFANSQGAIVAQYQSAMESKTAADASVRAEKDLITAGYLAASARVATAQAKVIDGLVKISTSLKNFLGLLDTTDLGGTSSAQQYSALKDQFLTQSQLAIAGDAGAAEGLAAVAQNFLRSSATQAQSSVDLARDVATVKNAISKVMALTDASIAASPGETLSSGAVSAAEELIAAQADLKKWTDAVLLSGASLTQSSSSILDGFRAAVETQNSANMASEYWASVIETLGIDARNGTEKTAELSAAISTLAISGGAKLSDLGIKTGADLASLGINIDKLGLTSSSDLLELGIKTGDQLAALGINITGISLSAGTELASLGIRTGADLASLGINMTGLNVLAGADLASLGIRTAADLVALGVNIGNLGIASGASLAALGSLTGDQLSALGVTITSVGLSSGANLSRLGLTTANDLSAIGIQIDALSLGGGANLAALGIKTGADLAALGINLNDLGISTSTKLADLGITTLASLEAYSSVFTSEVHALGNSLIKGFYDSKVALETAEKNLAAANTIRNGLDFKQATALEEFVVAINEVNATSRIASEAAAVLFEAASNKLIAGSDASMAAMVQAKSGMEYWGGVVTRTADGIVASVGALASAGDAIAAAQIRAQIDAAATIAAASTSAAKIITDASAAAQANANQRAITQAVTNAYTSIGRTGIGQDVGQIDVQGLEYWQAQLMSGAVSAANFQKTFLTSVTQYDGPNAVNYASRMQLAQALLDSGVDLPGFAVGTNYVPYDMSADIHRGERIIPAADNAELMSRLRNPSDNNAALIAEVRSLREEVRGLRDDQRIGDQANVMATKQVYKLLNDVTDEGTSILTTPAGA